MNSVLATCPPPGPSSTHGHSGYRRHRRRFAFAATGLLTVLLTSLSVSFAAASGTTGAAVSAPRGSRITVYTVGDGGAPPTARVLPHGSSSTPGNATWVSAVVPGWSVAAGTAGTVTAAGAGDLALLDATATDADTMALSLHVTNMAELATTYSSYNFNITLYQSADGRTGWRPVESQVLTSDMGALNWTVALEVDTDQRHYAVSIDEGGSFYTASATGEASALSPAFFIRA